MFLIVFIIKHLITVRKFSIDFYLLDYVMWCVFFVLYYNFYQQNGHCKFEKKKEVILLLTCGRKCDNFVVNMLEKQLNFILKYLNAKVFSKIVWDETDASLELSQNIWQEINT